MGTKLSLKLRVSVEITQVSTTESTIRNKKLKKHSGADLLGDIGREMKITDDLHHETIEKLVRILRSAVERFDHEHLSLDLNNPFDNNEMEQIQKLALDSWSGSIALFDMPEYCWVTVDMPEYI